MLAITASCLSALALSTPSAAAAATLAAPNQLLTPGQAAAQAKATGKPVEITSTTSETSRSLANPDGTTTVDLNTIPVRVRKNGSWTALDATLHANSDGTISPAATTSSLALSAGGSGPMATMTTASGARLSISWPGELPAPVLSGATATYKSVLPGVDLLLTANTAGGFSDVLVVQDAAAAANPQLATLRMPISTTGLTVTADAAGNIRAVDAVGTVQFNAPAPLMWDSTTPTGSAQTLSAEADNLGGAPEASTADEPGAAAIVHPLDVQVDAAAITLRPPAGSLTAADNHYPLYIDPSWVSTGPRPSGWTYVDSYHDTTSYYNSSDRARAGYTAFVSPYYKARTFWKYTIPTAIWGKHINTAILQTTEEWSANSSAYMMDINHIGISNTTISSSTTWANQPAKGALIATKLAPGDWRSDDSESPIEVDFDLTNEIKSAASGRWSYDTIGLYNETETDKYAWRKFDNNPVLSITYNSAPNTPTSLSTQPATVCGSTTNIIGNTGVTLSAAISDPDGTNNPLTATFTITDTTPEPDVATPLTTGGGSGTTVSVSEPSAFFADGHSYTWNVKVTDGIDTATSTNCQFTVNHAAPVAPTVTSTNFNLTSTTAAAGSVGHFSITHASTGTKPVKYIYGLNRTPPTTSVNPGSAQTGWATTTADSNGDAADLQLTVKHVGPNVLYVYAIDSTGNAGALQNYSFNAAPKATADAYSDFNGDAKPDLLVVGTTNNPGLWLYLGTDKAGHIDPVAIQAGALGTRGTGSINKPADWTGATVSIADIDGNGTQDILVKLPTANAFGDNVEVLLGGGDGTFDVTDADNVKPLQLNSVDGTDQDQTVNQIIVLPDNQADLSAGGANAPYLNDLYAVVNDTLYLYQPTALDGLSYSAPIPLSSGWASRQITATRSTNGPALFARNTSTSTLTRWEGTPYNTTSGAGIPAGNATGSSSYTISGTWSTTAAPLVIGADVNLDGNPDLWNTTNANQTGLNANIYATGTTFATAVTNTGLTQATLVGEWDLGERTGSQANDNSPYSNTLTMTSGASFIPTGHNTNDAGAMSFTGASTQQATTSVPILRTDQSFSLSVWVYLTDTSTTTARTILEQQDTTFAAFFIQKRFNTWAFGRAASPSTGGVVLAQTTTAPVRNAWVHLAATYDATTGNMALYVNGVSAATHAACGCNWNATGGVLVGRTQWAQTNGEWWLGNADNIQLYQGLLTPAQITALSTQ
ncbi:LamG-like jellyroll fold domain-containing protein [Hamadaea sp. NPDC050747]|uniref:LamG-like jellyroll fold domain-containing protein n=1 Tax=Hamadaea sp. NPDC050747 TaxID=3155789 RepID=UPI0033FC91EF